MDDFRQTGRLGCARCYTTFEPPLRDLLRRLHGSTQHVGERYSAPPAAGLAEVAGAAGAAPDTRVSVLKEQLRRAVEAEDFELAAELRDRLKVLE